MTAFQEWLKEQSVSDEKTIELLKLCWNRAVKEACDLFGEEEGTDHGVEEKLEVK